MSAVPRSSEANPSPRATDLHRQSNSRDGWKLGRLNTDTNDWGQDPQRISSFASISTVRSKSAKCFDEEFLDSKKESKKVAWAPKSKHNLSSSSTKFPRHGRIESFAELNREGKQVKDFGRVRQKIFEGPAVIVELHVLEDKVQICVTSSSVVNYVYTCY